MNGDRQSGVTYVDETKIEPRGHEEICLTCDPSNTFLQELLTFQLYLNFNLLLTMTIRPSEFLTLKGANTFANQYSLFGYKAQTISTNLARILYLHKDTWIKNSTCSLSLYNPCVSSFTLVQEFKLLPDLLNHSHTYK